MDPSPNSTIQQEIPQELLTEILSYLPGKSLSKFSCVSKLFNLPSFTSNAFLLNHSRSPFPSSLFLFSSFIIRSDQLTTNTTNTDIATLVGSDAFDDSDYDYYDDEDYFNKRGVRIPLFDLPPHFLSHENVAVSNLCDGLICVFVGRNYLPDLCMLLYSVKINDFYVLPREKIDSFCGLSFVGRLIMCSLGFDPVSKEYKVFRVLSGEGCGVKYEVLVLGSGFRKRVIDDDVVPSSIARGLPLEGSFCLDGVIYWAIECLDNSSKSVIASFDLCREEFRSFEVSDIVGSSNEIEGQYYLTALKGSVTLFHWCRAYGSKTLEWCLVDWEKGVWSRKMSSFDIPRSIWGVDFQYVGGRILVQLGASDLSIYHCYDLEDGNRWLIQIKDGYDDNRVLQIRNDLESHFASPL